MTRIVNPATLRTAFLVGLILFTELAPAAWAYVPFACCFVLFCALYARHRDVFLTCCWPLLAIFAIGGVISLASGAITFDAGKGAYYASRPLVFIAAGIYLARAIPEFRSFRRATIIAAALLSVVFILRYVFDPAAATASRFELRETIGVGYITVALGAALIVIDLIARRVRWFEVGVLPIAAAAIYLSDSRSALVIMTVLVICFYVRSTLSYFGVLSLAVVSFFLTTPYIQLFVDPNTLTSLTHTLPSSLSEIISTNRFTEFDVNNGWRGFETYRAFSYVWDQSLISQITGLGWHALVPLYWHIKLGGSVMPDIPVFHNALSFVFVRSGYLGLILFLIQFWIWTSLFAAKPSIRMDRNLTAPRKFALGLLLALVASIPTVGSVYNPGGTGEIMCMFLGYCIGVVCRSRAKIMLHAESRVITSPARMPASPDLDWTEPLRNLTRLQNRQRAATENINPQSPVK